MTVTREDRFFVRKSAPLSDIDLQNRRAAATGGPRYAGAAAGADYNGHPLDIAFNAYKDHWSAHYYWGEFVWLAHGSLENCLRTCTRRCDESKQRGTCIIVKIDETGRAPESAEEQAALCRDFGLEEIRGTAKDAADFAYNRLDPPQEPAGPGV